PLGGRSILLQAEQGFGDTLFALRYVPRVIERGGKVVVRAPSPLVRLLRAQNDIGRVVASDQPVPDVPIYCPMMSLPRLFETRVEDMRATVPYVTPDPKLTAVWKTRIDQMNLQGKRIGLAWAGRPTPPNRSIPFAV